MNCIYTERIFEGNTFSDGYLVAEDEHGERSELIKELTLIVSAGRYRITNGKGNVLRQGLCDGSPQAVFSVYDSTNIDCKSLRVLIDDFSGTFEDFELRYGFNRVERTNNRKFYAFTEATEGYTAIGVAELSHGFTKSIHSLYIPEAMSRKKKTEYLCEYIYGLLEPAEYAGITATGFSFDKVNYFKYGDGSLRSFPMAKESKHAEQPHLLAIQAAERQESITETFDQGFQYEVEGAFKTKEEMEVTENAGGKAAARGELGSTS